LPKPFTLTTLKLANSRSLDIKVLVEQRFLHQTKETSKAIRQLGHEWIDIPAKPTLQDSLRQRIWGIGSKNKKSSTAGVGRQVRHNGIFVDDEAEGTSGRQQNKEVAQLVAAMVSLYYYPICLAFADSLLGVHSAP